MEIPWRLLESLELSEGQWMSLELNSVECHWGSMSISGYHWGLFRIIDAHWLSLQLSSGAKWRSVRLSRNHLGVIWGFYCSVVVGGCHWRLLGLIEDYWVSVGSLRLSGGSLRLSRYEWRLVGVYWRSLRLKKVSEFHWSSMGISGTH